MKKAKKPHPKYAKMWETRRARAAAELEPKYDPHKPLEIDQEAFLKDVADQMPQTSKPRSDVDAISKTLDLNREEQLLAFLGDMWAIRESKRHNDHFPILVSRTQVEAIESFLGDHGYSAWGKGSGRFASVSTDPNTRAA